VRELLILIKIKKENNNVFLSASVTDFADSLGYCEYKIPLSIKGVKPQYTPALIQGTKAHHEKEQYEAKHVELEPVTVTEIKDESKDIEFARENIYSTLAIPFEFPSENVLVSLSGRIDKIMRIDGTLIVQDDKFAGKPQVYDSKTQPYPSQLLQVLTYLNSHIHLREAKSLRISLRCRTPKNNGKLEFVIERAESHTRYFLKFKIHFHYIICIRLWRDLPKLH
tara:strand:- start:105 stop:776 length:672 start_codon:yes stop_codon:yes gene_type:complete